MAIPVARIIEFPAQLAYPENGFRRPANRNDKKIEMPTKPAQISGVLAGVLPDGKTMEVKKLQESGAVVAMVGLGGCANHIDQRGFTRRGTCDITFTKDPWYHQTKSVLGFLLQCCSYSFSCTGLSQSDAGCLRNGL